MGDITTLTNLRGPAARITSATAGSVPADQPAEVTMSGPDQNRSFAFKVPRGLPGVLAIENDDAVATYVAAEDSQTRAALETAMADRIRVSTPGGDTENRMSPSSVHAALPQSGRSHNAFPGVTKLPDGRYLASWRAASGHSVIDGVAVCSWFTQGLGWSPVEQIDTDEATGDVRDVGLSVDGSKVILTFYHRSADETVRESYFKTSIDNGATWTPRTEIPFGWNDYTFISAPMTVLPDGSWLAGAYGRNVGEAKQRIGVVRSTDQGATWGVRVDLTGEGDYSEINMISLGGPGVLALIRQTPEARWMLSATSADNGVTWTTPVNAFLGEGNPHMTRLRDGRVIVVYRSLEWVASGLSAYAATRTFDGTVWTSELQFGRASWWMVYGDTVETEVDGELLCVWAAESDASNATIYATMLTSGASVTAQGQTTSPLTPSSKIAKQYIRLGITEATVPVAAATWTAIPWSSKIIDYWKGWAPATPTKIVVNEDGLYMVHLQVRTVNAVTGDAFIAIARTGGGAGEEIIVQANHPGGTYADLTAPVQLAPGFEYEARVFFTSASTISGTPSVSRTRLTVAKLKGY